MESEAGAAIAIQNISGLAQSPDIPRLRGLCRQFLAPIPVPCTLSVVLVNDQQIAAMNRQYLEREGPTDVIAFSLLRGAAGDYFTIPGKQAPYAYTASAQPQGPPLLSGEIYLSLEQALAYAQSERTSLDHELAFICVHGLLHLVGYQDNTQATKREMIDTATFFLQTVEGAKRS